MDNGTILTASQGRPTEQVIAAKNIALQLSPAFARIGDVRRAVQAASVFLSIRAHFATTLALQIGGIAGFYALVATYWGAIMSGRLVHGTWESKPVRRLRRLVFYEFAVFVLGSGYAVILALFWPGWWVLAATASTIWYFWT